MQSKISVVVRADSDELRIQNNIARLRNDSTDPAKFTKSELIEIINALLSKEA